MQVNNINSQNFGMAYIVKDKKALAKHLGSLNSKSATEIVTMMKEAKEKLKDTQLVDLLVYISEDNKLCHELTVNKAMLNQDGQVYCEPHCTTYLSEYDIPYLIGETKAAEAIAQEELNDRDLQAKIIESL